MSLFDEINKGTQLPEPRTPAQFESIDTSSDDDDSLLKVTNRVCKPKNPDLYTPNPRDYINQDSTDMFPDYNEITSTILETTGGDSHSNKAIEQRWKAKVKQNQSPKENGEHKDLAENVSNAESKKFFKSSDYKNNPLMRNLIEQKMAELQVSNLASSSNDGGKITIENNLPINDAMLIANPDNPDIFFLRDTSRKTEFSDDGFRFKHRGVKKKMTSRQYLIHEIDDDDFVFKRKFS